MSEKSRFVIDPEIAEHLVGQDGVKFIDAAWYLPAQNRNALGEYEAGHIPGAVFFDQDAIADHSTGLPHTLPSPEFFAAELGRLGISEKDRIIVYDGPGYFSAPRVWFLLRIMGARDVTVLEGGLDAWKAAGRPLEAGRPTVMPVTFTPDFDRSRVVFLDEMRGLVDAGTVAIADARGPGRFRAEEPEPRAGVRGGHMPGARNVPAAALSEGGRLKDLDSLRQIFATAGVDLSGPVVTSCGSGVTAAVVTLALESLGHADNRLYDGSWTEWGSQTDTPIEQGAAR